jgi:hypothetical protein
MAADPQPPPGHLAIYIPADAITKAITGSAREWGDPLAQAMRRLEPQITQAVQSELGRLLQEDAFREELRAALRQGLLEGARAKGADLVAGLSKVKTRELLSLLPDPTT